VILVFVAFCRCGVESPPKQLPRKGAVRQRPFTTLSGN
jgi:hypothetical protein